MVAHPQGNARNVVVVAAGRNDKRPLSVMLIGIEDADVALCHSSLEQNYPHPFNPHIAISDVNLSIYNLNGQLVRTLLQDEQAAGRYTVHWDGCDDLGKLISSAIYLYRLQAGDKVQTKRMLLMK